MPASDGEEYFAMALFFAAHRWGNGKGIYNYRAEADKILRGMRHHAMLTATPPDAVGGCPAWRRGFALPR